MLGRAPGAKPWTQVRPAPEGLREVQGTSQGPGAGRGGGEGLRAPGGQEGSALGSVSWLGQTDRPNPEASGLVGASAGSGQLQKQGSEAFRESEEWGHLGTLGDTWGGALRR